MTAKDPFGDAVARAVPRVYAYVAYRLGHGARAEDVTSATVERALRYRASYNRQHGAELPWLLGIARRCLADEIGSPASIIAEAPIEEPRDLDSRLDLRVAIAGLQARERELVALRYGADLTAKEIAAVLEMTPGAVDVALHRALERLRSSMSSPRHNRRLRVHAPLET